MFGVVFSGAVPLPKLSGLSASDNQTESQLGKKVERKTEGIQSLDYNNRNLKK